MSGRCHRTCERSRADCSSLRGRLTASTRKRSTPAGTAETRAFLRAIFAGYPDRVARRRAPGSPKFLLASGHGAVLGRDSGVRDAEFIVAVDVQAGSAFAKATAGAPAFAKATARPAFAGTARQARARHGGDDPDGERDRPGVAEPPRSPHGFTDRSHGLHGLHGSRIDHEFDAASGRVRATEREYYGEIVHRRSARRAIDPEVAARLLAEAYRARGWSEADTQLLRRLRFAGALSRRRRAPGRGRGRPPRDRRDRLARARWDWEVSRTGSRPSGARRRSPSRAAGRRGCSTRKTARSSRP